MRILGYSCNGFGFGHLTRMTALLCALRNALRKEDQNFSPLDVLLLTEADSLWPAEYFKLPVAKIPSRLCASSGKDCPEEIKAKLGRLSRAAISEYNPDILIVDTFLSGSFGEFSDQELFRSHYTVFINRERKKEAVRLAAEKDLLKYINHSVVPHLRGQAAVVPFDEDLTDWVGPFLLARYLTPLSRSEARRKLGIAESVDALLLYVGPLASPDLKGEEKILSQALLNVSPETVIFLLGASSELYGTRPLQHSPAAELLPAFDCAVSAAGYNTFHELLTSGIPSAFFARERIYDDQRARIERYAEKAGCLHLDLQGASLEKQLSPLFNREMRNELANQAKALVPDNGVDLAAGLILKRYREHRK